jgi:hypothetical protein
VLENIIIFDEGTADQFPNAQARFSSLSTMDTTERAELIRWITILHASPTMRAVWARLLADDGKIFFGKVDFSSDPALVNGGGAFGDGRFIGIDFDEIRQVRWFNGVGEVVQGEPELLLAHEFGHLENPATPLGAGPSRTPSGARYCGPCEAWGGGG